MQFFNDGPKTNIILGHELFKNWERVIKQNKGSNSSDLYLVQTGKIFEFIHKHSWRGRWLALKVAIKRVFSGKDDALAIESNLKKVAAVFENANDLKFFDQVANQLSENEVTSQKLQQEFQKLREELENLKNHVQQRRVAKKRNIQSIAEISFPSFAIKTHQAAAPFFHELKTFREETDQLLNQIFKNQLIEEQKSEIISLLHADIGINEIIEGMKRAQTEREPLRSPSLEPLRLALMKGLAYVSEEKTTALYTALEYLNPPLLKEKRQFNFQLQQFAMVFGDSFIRNSGLEGDVSSRPYVELMAEFIQTRGYQSGLASQLVSFLTNSINLKETVLSSEDLRKEIKKTLKAFPGEKKKCLLVGGWVGHRVVYEIEKQTDGRYAFRIFNKGDGIELADQLQESYRLKVAGCISVKNIPEKLLFKKNFLASLQAISSMTQDGVKGVKPQEFLVGHLLPMLGGEKEIVDPRIDHFLLPQKSGTCPYASLQACMAHMMSSEEFQRFECEFKTYLLEKYRLEIDHALATPIEKNSYPEFRCHYLTLKRSIETFADSLKQTQGVIPEKSLKAAERQILVYQAYAGKMEKKLLDFEKKTFTESLKSLSKKTNPMRVEGSFYSNEIPVNNSQSSLIPERLTVEELTLCKLIEKIPEFPDHPDYSSSIVACLAEISRPEYRHLELVFLADLFFKKIGPLANWKKVAYPNPQEAFNHLCTLQNHLSEKIGGLRKYQQTRERLMFLSASIALEEAVKQLPAKERVICFDQVGSILSSLLLPKLNHLRCSDPYWVSVIREMKEIASSTRSGLFSNMANLFQGPSEKDINRKIQSKTTYLSSYLTNQIWNWWSSDENKELRNQVFESCKKDRPVQEEEKASRIKAEETKKEQYKIEIEQCEAEKKSLKLEIELQESEKIKLKTEVDKLDSEVMALKMKLPQIKKELPENQSYNSKAREQQQIYAGKDKIFKEKNNAWLEKSRILTNKMNQLININNGIAQYNRMIDSCNLMILQIPDLVEKDAKYWPKGFEKGQLDRQTIATFLFACQPSFFRQKLGCFDLLPQPFRNYCRSCLFSQNIDHKKFLGEIPIGSFNFNYKSFQSNRIDDLKQLSIHSTDTFAATSEFFEDDPYYPHYTDENFKRLYTNVFQKKIDETNLPASVSKQSVPTFNREVIKELESIRSSTEVQIESAIYYFKENADLLGQNSWVNCFHSLLFESDLLLSELEDDKKRALLLPKLRNFFQVTIRNAIELDDMAMAANLAWIASDTQKYLDLAAENRRKQNQPPLQEEPILTSAQLLELAKQSSSLKYVNQWPVVSEALLAAFESLFEKPLLSNEEKELFIFACMAHLMHKKFAIPPQNVSYSRRSKAEEAIKKLKSWFSDSPLPLSANELNQLVNQHGVPILNAMYPSLNIQTFANSPNPLETDCFVTNEGSKISLTNGRILASDPEKLRIYDSPVEKIMTDLMIEQGIYSFDDDLSQLRCFVENQFVHIRDFNKRLDFVVNLNRKNPKNSEVYVNLGGEIGRALYKPMEERKYISNHELKRKYHHLVANHLLYLCDPVTFKPLLQSYSQRAGVSIIGTIPEAVGQESLIVSEMSEAFFDTFEDRSCTIYWSGGQQLKKISFPRLNITLKREIQSGQVRWIFAQDPRWFLAKEQFVPHFGQSTGFMVLENNQAQKKVLFPVWNSGKEKDSSLNFPYKYVFDAENSRTGRVIECDLVGTKVVPKTDEARFYLAKIYLEKGMVDKAEELLFSVEAELNHKAYSEEALAMLQQLYSSPLSESIDAIHLRIRMHALYLYEKNCDQFPKKSAIVETKTDKEKVEILETKKELINQYLERNNELLLLPEHEELLVCKKIMPNSPRIKELESKSDPELGQMSIGQNERKELEILSKFRKKYNDDFIPYGCYRPSLKDRVKYKWARLANTFPFNPQSVKEEEFKKYYKMLESECARAPDWDKANKNGLAQALYYLTCFSNESKIQKMAENLLSPLASKWKEGPRENHSSHLLPKHPRALPTGRTLYQGLQDLVMVTSMFQADDAAIKEGSSFSAAMVEKYFEKNETGSLNISSQKLFDTNYPEVSNQTIKLEFERMAQDLDAANLTNVEYNQREPLGGLKAELEIKLQTESKSLTDHEQLITNALASALTADSVSHLEFASKKRSLPSIEEVCMLFARNDYHSFAQQLYPELSKEGRENLQKAVKHYLIQKQQVQQIGRSLRKLEELLAAQNEGQINEDVLKMLRNQVGSSLDEKRCYDLDKDHYAPIFLLMETVLNITLRQDQVDNIKKFAEAAGNNQAIALQMIMGAGKTFVLQPVIAYLLTFMFADSSRLSTVIVPEALFQPVIESLSKCLGTAFNQFIFFMPYDRELAKDESYLTTYLNRLKEAKDRGACLFMTPRQKHSILTSLYEAYFDWNKSKGKQDQTRINLIADICHFLEEHEIDQVDEIDTIMRPDVIFKYPIGEKEKINQERGSAIVSLMVQFAADPDLSEKVSIDFVDAFQKRVDPAYVKKGQTITEELFYQTVQPKLVDIACSILENKEGRPFKEIIKHDPFSYVRHFISQTTPYDEEIRTSLTEEEEQSIIDQLKQKMEALPEIAENGPNPIEQMVARKLFFKIQRDSWVKSQFTDADDRELLGVLGLAVSRILPKALFKECGSKYGIDPNQEVFTARPYDAPDAPKPTNFQGPYEQCIYSTMLNIFYGPNEKAAKLMLNQLRDNAQLEMKRGHRPIFETGSYQELIRLLGPRANEFRLFDKEPSEGLINSFHEALKKDAKSIQLFMIDHAMDQISLYKKSLFSTAHTMMGSSRLSSGYTGTMQQGILPRNMKAVPEIGTDGKTMSAVQSKMEAGLSDVRVYREENQRSLTDQIIESYIADPEQFVFIDSGAWLKEVNIDRYTEKLLAACENSENRRSIKGIVYHNIKGEIISLERNPATGAFIRLPLTQSKYKTTNRELLTIIQKKYDTGTNIPQHPTAKAIMSIPKNCNKRDALQAIFRMRQILFGQKVSFAVSEDVNSDVATAVVHGLLQKEPFKQLFNLEGVINPQEIIDRLNLPQGAESFKHELMNALTAFLESETYGQFRAGEINKKAAILSFSKHFSTAFEINSDSLWRYFAANQALDTQNTSWPTAQQSMREVVEKLVRRTLSNKNLPVQERGHLFEVMIDFLVETIEDTPFGAILSNADSINAEEAVRKEVNRNIQLANSFQSLPPNLRQTIAKNFKEFYGEATLRKVLESCVNMDEMPSVLKGWGNQAQEIEVEVELEQEQETEVELEQEVQVEMTMSNLSEVSYRPLNSMRGEGYEMEKFLIQAKGKEANPLASVLPPEVRGAFVDADSIDCSSNLMLQNTQLGTTLAGSYHLPGRFLLALSNPKWGANSHRYLIVSKRDAALIKNGLINSLIPNGCHAGLFALNGDLVAGDIECEKVFNDEKHQRVLLQTRFILGKINFSEEETNRFKSFIPDAKTQLALSKFHRKILAYLPETAKHYPGTYLDRMLNGKK